MHERGSFAHVMVLTGAGVSADSGVRTFRDAGGLWEGHRPEDVERMLRTWFVDRPVLALLVEPQAEPDQAASSSTAGEMPVNTTVLSELDVRESAWQPADQILRQVPGFSLLRSADSIAAAPTTTTVSLRGLGGSAASRTLVLLDGMPLHSPYTTEIFWARVPRHRIERVEVVRGGGANAWGNLSLGGVINIVTRKPASSGFQASATLGAPWTVDLAGTASFVDERWTLTGDAAWYDTDGYYAVPDDQRGPVDTRVRKDHGMVSGRAQYRLGDATRLMLNGSSFHLKKTR